MSESKDYSIPDSLQRFLFEHVPVRGELVHLDSAWRNVIERHDYPDTLQTVMGELTAAAVLLAATLKLRGALVLQVIGKGPVKLLVVECSGDLKLRATAKWSGDLAGMSLRDMVGAGQFSITLDPKDGGQPYQGIVELEGNTVAEIMQNYMSVSEQLESRLWLAADGQHAAGLLIQKLPDNQQTEEAVDEDAWPRAVMLAETITPEELLNLSARMLIHRLYHEEDVRLFDAQPVAFACSCSRENVASMLKMLGKTEVDDILAEQGMIDVHCEFCNQQYLFDKVDAEVLFLDAPVMAQSQTHH